MKQSIPRIGKIKPKLDVLAASNVRLFNDRYDEVQDVVAAMIDAARRDGIRSFAIITVDEDGLVDRQAVIRPGGAKHPLIGGLFAMAHDLADTLD